MLVDAGLARINRVGRTNDVFRGRVLFPIFDAKGDAVAFGGRVLPGSDDPAKYKNSAESAIYAKSKVLYGLNWAKGAIVAADEAIVCEGYTDVIGFAAAGVPRAVATCGTALTEEHFRTLKSFARRVVLAFDADAAGQNAAARFYEWERAYDIDVAVAALPPGVDPADLARSDPEALVAAVTEATPFLGFRLNRVLDAASLVSPEGRARAAEAAMAVINEHPSDLVRDQYLMEVASRCRIDPDKLRSGTFAPAGGPAARGKAVPTSPGAGDAPCGEARLARDRGAAAAGGRSVDHRRVRSTPGLFTDDLNYAVYQALVSTPTLRDAVESADPAAADLLQRLAVEDTEADPADVVARLVEEAARRELRDHPVGGRFCR